MSGVAWTWNMPLQLIWNLYIIAFQSKLNLLILITKSKGMELFLFNKTSKWKKKTVSFFFLKKDWLH